MARHAGINTEENIGGNVEGMARHAGTNTEENIGGNVEGMARARWNQYRGEHWRQCRRNGTCSLESIQRRTLEAM